MEIAAVLNLQELFWHWLLVFGIALARPMALLTLNPVFNRIPLTGLLRGAVASALALPMTPVISAALPRDELGSIALLFMTLLWEARKKGRSLKARRPLPRLLQPQHSHIYWWRPNR
jgi:hypothetical protein